MFVPPGAVFLTPFMPKDPKDSPPPIFAAERQERIAALVTSRGRIHLDELASVFEVSQPTLRKDLNILARQGLVKRTHGGALSTRAPAERDIMTRFVQNVEAKQAIGLACCDLIEEGEAIYLDCGTTTHHVAQHLATRGLQLTVLTNSPSISECLADAGSITHILLGGQLRRKSGGISGPLALEIVNQFAISTAFIGVSGITEEALTVADYNEARLKAAIIKRTQKVIVPMDRSKVGFVDFARVCQPRDVDIIVTDSANEDLRRICKDHEIKLEDVST
jgi:DeoR/GlpR family transcriptional regulator of sugar metabolism